MARVFAALLLALVAVEIGLSSTVLGSPCAESCEDDGPDGQCPPDCADCLCCSHVRVTVGRASLTEAPLARSLGRAWIEDAAPPAPEPGEILRVPKAA